MKTIPFKMPWSKDQILGCTLGFTGVTLLALGGVSIQALDKCIPVFQLNVARLVGKE